LNSLSEAEKWFLARIVNHNHLKVRKNLKGPLDDIEVS
jgi:hypothetical protein